jgi:hypothetical protein
VTGTGGASQRPGGGFTIGNKPPPRKKEPGQRDRLIEVAVTSGITYWHDPDGNAFATVKRDGRIERYRVRSAAFKQLLRRLYGDAYPNLIATKKAGFTVPGGVSDTAMNEVLPTLEALAQNGPTRVPAVRVCGDPASTIWIDLGDETWRLVKVTAAGWQIVPAADVPLIRPNGMRALPEPVRDSDALTKLRQLLNLNPKAAASKAAAVLADISFKLTVSFKLVVLWPRGPYPILSVNGVHGSAKTTGCKIIRACTDPNKAPMRSVPRNPDDLFVTAQHSRLLSLDNVSQLFPELADVLCGISTGSGKGARQLYTDGDEVILGAHAPIMVNGIEGVLTRADLADRCLTVVMQEISDEDRRDEAEMEVAIAAAVPGVLALLLDAMVTAIGALPTLKLSRMPRMADFTRLACAAAPAFGWTVEEMFEAIEDNRKVTVEAVIAADPVATALLELLGKCIPDLEGYLWIGTATQLLKQLRRFVTDDTAKSKAWPKTTQHLSGRITRILPGLRRAGFTVVRWRGEDKKRERGIGIRRVDADIPLESGDKTASGVSERPFANDIHDLGPDAMWTQSSREASSTTGADGFPRAPWTLNEAEASVGASARDAEQWPDNIEESHYDDAADAADAGLPSPSDADYETDADYENLVAAATTGAPLDDDEGEL